MTGCAKDAGAAHSCDGYTTGRCGSGRHHTTSFIGSGTIEKIEIGQRYDTTYGTLWKDGTYFPRGTRVHITGLHIEQGFCVRFPVEVDGEPLETWEDWDEIDFLAEEGSVESGGVLPASVLHEAREVLDDAEDGCHLHLHEGDE
ncbi:MAG: hypothetical protein NVS4B13_06390 [Candidatus Elarobacter sp.]